MTNSHQSHLILIISADSHANYLMERILLSMGHTVEISTSFEQAQQYLQPLPPDLIIIHENLLILDKLSWVKSTHHRFPALPLMLYSLGIETDFLISLMPYGFKHVISPPIQKETFNQIIEQSLSDTIQLRQWILRESRRNTQQLQSRVNELEALSRLGQSVTGSLDLDIVLKEIVDAAVEVTGSEQGSLLLLDEKSGELYMRASRNFNDDFVNTFRLPIQDSLAGSVLRNGKPVILDEKTPQKIKTAYLVNSLIYVPLKLKGSVLGVLGVDNRHKRVTFKQNDVSLLTAMAEFAVIAIQNANLFNESENEQNKLNAIIRNIEDGVLVLDQDNRLILINNVAEAVLNLQSPVPSGMTIKELLLEPELAAQFEYGLPTESIHTEIIDKEEQTFSTQITPIPGVGTAITFHNITYLKKLDQIKNDFVSTVSHDLRSPLTAILGYVELLERVGPINNTQKEFIDRVQTSVHNITNLVDDLLNLGRIEAGFDTRKEFLDLGKLVAFTIEGMHKVLKTQQQTISTEIAESLPQIFGSPIQLRQLISNLLSNACKYSPKGSNIEVQIKQERNQLIFTITDEGFGIPAIDLPHIFEKFYRAGNIGTDISGTGLGLAIVKTIVDSHQGRIWVDSVIGQGTTFTVVLPISE